MKLTLSQVFTLSLLGLAAMLGLLFYVVMERSEAALVESSEQVRAGASREIGERVARFLRKAPDVVRQIQIAIKSEVFDPREIPALEAALSAPLIADQDIGEMTLTYGEKVKFDQDGEIKLAPRPRGQLSVERSAGPKGEERLWSRHLHLEDAGFMAERRDLLRTPQPGELRRHRELGTDFFDPTQHPTFTTPASDRWYGKLLPSDLHWSQLDADAALPEEQRRVEVSVQQVLTDAAGEFVGVLRVGLLARQLERAVQVNLGGVSPGADSGHQDPHRVFLCDTRGRLVTRGVAADRPMDFDGDLRVNPHDLPLEMKEALLLPALRELAKHGPVVADTFRSAGVDYFATFRALPGTQDWVAGIVVPRAYYLGRLAAMRNQLLLLSVAIIAVVLIAGGFVLRAVRRAQARIVRRTARMKLFQFAPSSTNSPFRDVSEVLESLEQAKTAMRAMGKYVPVDLVRRLYRARTEPALGSESTEISIMFTDIRDFTALSEKLEPNELASALGKYLQTMAGVIQQECHGTIDKYIGDAIMTIWNAPEPLPEHARFACQAALWCRAAGRALAESDAWKGRPAFETRFGLHSGRALVGHFGAPDRLSYTAIGDAVNLASRLEGLNKVYGTSIIASESIVLAAGGGLRFRLLDLVAVKGKEEAVKIYELLGEEAGIPAEERVAAGYEKAFTAYLARDFSTAIKILLSHDEDGPSHVLLERCLAYRETPPPQHWNGVYAAKEK